jgi:ribosomal protein S6
MSTTEDQEIAVYEVGYSILTSVPEEKVGDVVTKIQKAITDEEGKLLDSEEPFKQELAYKMSKTMGARKYVANEAYIGWMKFESTPEKTPVIKANLDKIEEVLRFLLIKAPRETAFTFEGARKAKEEAEEALMNPEEVVTEDVKTADSVIDDPVLE